MPEFKDWREWEGEVGSGHFYTEDLEQVRKELLAEGHCPKVVMRSMSEWRCLRLRVRGGKRTASSAPSTRTWRCCRPGWAGWGSPIAGSAWRARRARSSFTFSRRAGIRPGLGRPCSRSRTTSASSARRPSPRPRASWTTSSPCTSPSPHRPRICRPCASSATGTKRPWSSRTPRRWSPLQPAGLRGLRGIAPAAPAGLQAQQPQAGADLPRNRRGPVPQECVGPRQVPGTHLLPQGQHGASPRGAPGGPDLREALGGRALGDLPAAPLRGRRLVRQARGGLHA